MEKYTHKRWESDLLLSFLVAGTPSNSLVEGKTIWVDEYLDWVSIGFEKIHELIAKQRHSKISSNCSLQKLNKPNKKFLVNRGS